MKPKALLPYSLLVALTAGVVTLITWQMDGFLVHGATPLTYVTFCSWAGYFLFGAAPRPAVHAFASMAAGIVAAIIMFVLSIKFGFTPWWAVPVAVFIVVIGMMWLEKVPPVSNVAAVFLGTGLYFSLSAAGAFANQFTAKQYFLVGLTELVYIAIGFVAGWVTIQLAGLSQNLAGAPEPTDAAAQKETV